MSRDMEALEDRLEAAAGEAQALSDDLQADIASAESGAGAAPPSGIAHRLGLAFGAVTSTLAVLGVVTGGTSTAAGGAARTAVSGGVRFGTKLLAGLSRGRPGLLMSAASVLTDFDRGMRQADRIITGGTLNTVTDVVLNGIEGGVLAAAGAGTLKGNLAAGTRSALSQHVLVKVGSDVASGRGLRESAAGFARGEGLGDPAFGGAFHAAGMAAGARAAGGGGRFVRLGKAAARAGGALKAGVGAEMARGGARGVASMAARGAAKGAGQAAAWAAKGTLRAGKAGLRGAWRSVTRPFRSAYRVARGSVRAAAWPGRAAVRLVKGIRGLATGRKAPRAPARPKPPSRPLGSRVGAAARTGGRFAMVAGGLALHVGLGAAAYGFGSVAKACLAGMAPAIEGAAPTKAVIGRDSKAFGGGRGAGRASSARTDLANPFIREERAWAARGREEAAAKSVRRDRGRGRGGDGGMGR